jgi:hypothetical protein
VGLRLSMSTISECKVYGSPWRTSCPSLGTGGFILVVTISLSEQITGNSNLKRNLQFISKYVEIWRMFQYRKLIQIMQYISQSFSVFVIPSSYFSWAKTKICNCLKLKKENSRGPTRQWLSRFLLVPIHRAGWPLFAECARQPKSFTRQSVLFEAVNPAALAWAIVSELPLRHWLNGRRAGTEPSSAAPRAQAGAHPPAVQSHEHRPEPIAAAPSSRHLPRTFPVSAAAPLRFLAVESPSLTHPSPPCTGHRSSVPWPGRAHWHRAELSRVSSTGGSVSHHSQPHLGLWDPKMSPPIFPPLRGVLGEPPHCRWLALAMEEQHPNTMATSYAACLLCAVPSSLFGKGPADKA